MFYYVHVSARERISCKSCTSSFMALHDSDQNVCTNLASDENLSTKILLRDNRITASLKNELHNTMIGFEANVT